MHVVAKRMAWVFVLAGCTGGFDAGETQGCTVEMVDPAADGNVPTRGDGAWLLDPPSPRPPPEGIGADGCPPRTLACDGACVDPYGDRLHCGACGHRCGPLEDCVGLVCGPAEPRLLASGLPASVPFSVGFTHVAWFDAPFLRTMPVAGGPIVELASFPGVTRPYLQTGSSFVFFAAEDAEGPAVWWLSLRDVPAAVTRFEDPITGVGGHGDQAIVATAGPSGGRLWWAARGEAPVELAAFSTAVASPRQFGEYVLFAVGAEPEVEGDLHLLDLDRMESRPLVPGLREPSLLQEFSGGGVLFAWTPAVCDERESPRELRRVDLATGGTETLFPIGCGAPVSDHVGRVFFPRTGDDGTPAIAWRSFDGEAEGRYPAAFDLHLLGAFAWGSGDAEPWLYGLRPALDGHDLIRLPL